GEFPEGTMLPMDVFRPGSRESINQAGYFEKDFLGMEVAVKDSKRYPEGWAYLSFRDRSGGLRESASAFPKERCYDCHAEHAATDNVFTQFYPVLQRGEIKPASDR
ncbi:MAG: cytochrome P460, partial [Holophagales bacterium]|nr:cytochrome P460 [Holophagales bacterium]